MNSLIGRNSKVYKENSFVDKIEGINAQFTDNGLFGAKIQGAGSHSAQLMNVLLEQLNSLKQKINDEELATVKN